ncbi:lysozyme [Serratia sp. MF2]|uniref:lysozyme n=1 Tax=Serratia sp. MF1(2023) TaxID=3059171 RepID=UPI0027ED1C21|nr:lysozyme [Serratia sp. MF1(2023)]MDQ7104222.1 lysozyme [Serratia sp. MF1(2023)]
MNKKITCSVMAIIAMVLTMASSMTSNNGNPLRFSQKAMEVMGNAEGCRRDPYLCPAGVITQGIGHTGSGVKSGLQEASNEQIAIWFALDQMEAQNCIERNVERKIGKELPQGVFDGVGSFVFNVGCSKFLSSTMYKNLIDEKFTEACNWLPKWIYANGIKLEGLVKRRQEERALCLTF